MKSFLSGINLGLLISFPIFILAEYIRFGFVSHHIAIWVIIFVWIFCACFAQEGGKLGFIWRIICFFLYTIVSIILLLRIVDAHGLLLAILLIMGVYTCYALFEYTKGMNIE